jgi:hypothetical protein
MMMLLGAFGYYYHNSRAKENTRRSALEVTIRNDAARRHDDYMLRRSSAKKAVDAAREQKRRIDNEKKRAARVGKDLAKAVAAGDPDRAATIDKRDIIDTCLAKTRIGFNEDKMIKMSAEAKITHGNPNLLVDPVPPSFSSVIENPELRHLIKSFLKQKEKLALANSSKFMGALMLCRARGLHQQVPSPPTSAQAEEARLANDLKKAIQDQAVCEDRISDAVKRLAKSMIMEACSICYPIATITAHTVFSQLEVPRDVFSRIMETCRETLKKLQADPANYCRDDETGCLEYCGKRLHQLVDEALVSAGALSPATVGQCRWLVWNKADGGKSANVVIKVCTRNMLMIAALACAGAFLYNTGASQADPEYAKDMSAHASAFISIVSFIATIGTAIPPYLAYISVKLGLSFCFSFANPYKHIVDDWKRLRDAMDSFKGDMGFRKIFELFVLRPFIQFVKFDVCTLGPIYAAHMLSVVKSIATSTKNATCRIVLGAVKCMRDVAMHLCTLAVNGVCEAFNCVRDIVVTLCSHTYAGMKWVGNYLRDVAMHLCTLAVNGVCEALNCVRDIVVTLCNHAYAGMKWVGNYLYVVATILVNKKLIPQVEFACDVVYIVYNGLSIRIPNFLIALFEIKH